MDCPSCGAQNPANAASCLKCHTSLSAPYAAVPVSTVADEEPAEDSPVSVVVPYKNVPALVAYYLGVFSLIPCIGALLALGSITCGIYGLVTVKRNPLAHGTVHALVGIVLGGLVIVAHVGFFVWMGLQKR